MQTARRGPVAGLSVAGCDIRKRLLDAPSWLFETWKISFTTKNEAAVDA